MNPYLEQPEDRSDFQNQLVAAIARTLVPKLVAKREQDARTTRVLV